MDPNAQNNANFVAELQNLYNKPSLNKSFTSSVSNPFAPKSNDIIFTEEEVNKKISDSSDLKTRQNILSKIYDRYGASDYVKADKLSTKDLIDFANKFDVPFINLGFCNKSNNHTVINILH